MRTIAIGDVHGCSKALRAVIEAIQPTSEDRLVFLGDYVDRGPDSRGTIDYLIELESAFDTVFLKGNHEILLEGILSRTVDPVRWLQMGGQTTLVSYGGLLDSFPASHREFIDRCLPYFEMEDNFFVHANYLPDKLLREHSPETLHWEHLHDRFPKPHISGRTAWLGHSPQFDGEILDVGHMVCIDTYCFGGKYLSAVDIDTRAVWQADKQGMMRQKYGPLVNFVGHLFLELRRSLFRRKRATPLNATSESVVAPTDRSPS